MASHPVGLDVPSPRFSWKLKSQAEARAQVQTAYRILVATDPSLLGEGKADVWDSKRVESGDCVLVCLDSLRLQAKSRYFWTVKLWSGNAAGDYAPPASFETGIFRLADWFADGAKWIESPLEPVVDDVFEDWTRFAILDLKHYKVGGYYGRRPEFEPTPQELENAMQRYRKNLRDKVWSASMLRREFDAPEISRARLYICGLGYYRAYLNGKKIGDRDLAPSDSHFFANAYYQVYDVTDLVKPGTNCLGVELVNGRWRAWPGNTAETYNDRPILLARLELTDRAGRVRKIVSNEDWQCTQPAIRRQGFWIGEVYDARAYPEGWNTVGFNARALIPARAAKVGAKIRALTLDPMPPEKMARLIPPVKQAEPKPKVFVYDFGRMIGGRARFVFHGLKEGQRVVVRYAEAIDDRRYDAPYAIAHYDTFENTNQIANMLKFKRRGSTGMEATVEVARPGGKSVTMHLPGGAAAYTDLFVSAGRPVEVWTPNFTYTGFRYLEILGLDEPLPPGDIAAYDLRTDPKVIGSLTTDNPQLNRVLKGVQDTILANFHSQLQDNNGAERNPNALNLVVNDLNIAYWLDVFPLWRKGVNDSDFMCSYVGYPVNMICGMRDIQNKSKREINISNSLHYGSLPWDMIAFYNDRQAAERLLKWAIYFVRETSQYNVWESTYGSADHIAESSLRYLSGAKLTKDGALTDRRFFKSGCIIRVARLAIEVAEQLNRKNDAAELKRLLVAFEQRVKATFYGEKTQRWTPDQPSIQGRNLSLMYFMMEPRRSDQTLAAEIVNEIRTVTHGHQVTGSRLSYPMLHELSQAGYVDEAARLLLREEYPSLLEMINQTGNTIRESWGTMDSFAQIEGLTEMGKWFYTDLVGISPQLGHPGFARFTLKPRVPSVVHAYTFAYESPRGKIISQWSEQGGRVEWKIVVPPNSMAELHVPAAPAVPISEGGQPADSCVGVRHTGETAGFQVYEVSSGEYHFGFAKRKPDIVLEPYSAALQIR